METKTMRGVIWQKLVEAVDHLSLRQLMHGSALAGVAALYSAFLLDGGRTLVRLSEWHGGALPGIVLVNLVVWNIPRLWRVVRTAVLTIDLTSAIEEVEPEGDCLEGVSTAALIDHLFATRSFKRAEVELALGLPRSRYSDLADAMERIGILERGENNARVLSALPRARVAELLAGKSSAEELEIPINIVRPLPSPAPLFKVRTLSQTA